MKFNELKIKTEAELQKLLQESRLQLRELRFKTAADQLKNVREVRRVRQTIARVMMLLRQHGTAKNQK